MRHSPHIGRRRPPARGAALLSALVSVAVLTALAVDLAYQSRVSLQIAANARDELRAHYLARSGVAMGRLVLSFQQQLDASLGGQTAAGIPRVQLWNLVAVDQDLTGSLFSGTAATGSLFDSPGKRPAAAGSLFDAAAAKAPAAGAPPPRKEREGNASRGLTFDARIDDEGRKVNANLKGLIAGGDQSVRLRAQALYQLICDARWDPLFDREDQNGIRFTRDDILVNLRDYVNDLSKTASALAPAPGSTSAQCGLVLGSPPFVDNFGDKNRPYDRGDDRYKTKNKRMDSLDELYLVAGVGDAFMAAFGDSLTVYATDKQNINTLDKDMLVVLAGLLASPPNQPVLRDPEFATRLQKAVLLATAGGILSLTREGIGAAIAAAGVQINPNLLSANNTQSPFTDRSTVFRIRATGKVGAVRSGIDAVVRFDEQNTPKLPGEQIAAPGRIIHWREE